MLKCISEEGQIGIFNREKVDDWLKQDSLTMKILNEFATFEDWYLNIQDLSS